MKKLIDKIPNFVLYSIPLVIVFTVMLLAFYPGILSPDAMVQWNQVQTNTINNWHPAYTTIFIKLLSYIWNSPTFIIIIQDILIIIIISYTLITLEKCFNISKKWLFILSILFAINPLNFNLAVNMLKDTLFSYFLILLMAFIINIICDKKWLKKWYNILLLVITGILINLFRHNGIIITLLASIILIIVYKKEKILYLVFANWLIIYVLLTTIGFSVLNIDDASVSNKFGPISHIFAQILNNDNIKLSNEELNNLNNYVDVKQLKDTFDSYNMDYSINCQKIDYINEHKKEYLLFAFHVFKKYPKEVLIYYLKLDSFIYSPLPFKNSYVAGMFNESELYIYENTYPELKEQSKLPLVNKIIKKVTSYYQSSILKLLTMRPAIYIYLSIICVILIVKKLKIKRYYLILLPSILNAVSIAPAMPVASTRYLYISFLSLWFIGIITLKILRNDRK